MGGVSSSFTVRLPDSLRPLLEAEAAEHGFASVSDYVAALVHGNTAASEESPALEQALLDGLGSGEVRDADEAFWSDLRRRVADRASRA